MNKRCSDHSFVYCLVAIDQSGIKIGKSDNPVARMYRLPQEFNLKSSFFLQVERHRVLEIERAIHEALSPWRQRRKGDGGTEWFSYSCLRDFEEALEYEENRKFLSPFSKFQFSRLPVSSATFQLDKNALALLNLRAFELGISRGQLLSGLILNNLS